MLSEPDARRDGRLLRRAIAWSLAAHVLFALLLPLRAPDQTSGYRVETFALARNTRIAMQRAPAKRSQARPHLPRRAVRTAPSKVRPELQARTRRPQAQRPTALARGKPAISPGATSVAKAANVSGQVAAAPAPLPDARRPGAAASPLASPQPAPTNPAPAEPAGVMPFGAALPEPVLDPHVRAELARRFGTSHATLTVTVGDDGRTKDVRIAPPLDRTTENAIRSLLAAATWDAAVCGGGVACEAQAVIKL